MVKHIVLFKLKPFNSESERLAACEKIKSELSALVEKVPTLLTAEVGINCNPNEQFDIALTTTHNDMEGLKEYAQHPLHVDVAKNFIRPILEARSCCDYQY
ncbi:MAG: Dabb family protein [Bacteroidales bacterium]|jgi:hypothetical protein|nr:Dabb family protein [Paludibacteraceae bacterium]MDD5996643.1 Dabb family protein [Bacteroidales bacterium]MBO7627449.1 Dabb family protein [Paludibacteraceae bacterium]MBP5524470.1 Dabb family protein [Paludibacteraceae bacterium]MBP5705165.1 Dabb family protein [Paludibacteraceae bacterium]